MKRKGIEIKDFAVQCSSQSIISSSEFLGDYTNLGSTLQLSMTLHGLVWMYAEREGEGKRERERERERESKRKNDRKKERKKEGTKERKKERKKEREQERKEKVMRAIAREREK